MMDNRDKFSSANTVLVGIRTFKECYKENEKVFSPELVEFAFNVLNMVEEFVNKTPPADVAPVVHGEWIEDYVYAADPHDRLRYQCSVCGRVEEDKKPYCNCGAKMDR